MINEFITYLRDTKGKADNTLVAYRRDVISFEKFLKNHSGRELAECKESDSIAYILDLNNDSKSKATINRKLSSLRTFYDFEIEAGAPRTRLPRLNQQRMTRGRLSFCQ